MAVKTVFITSGTTYTIPSDFGTLISVECIGGGGGAGSATGASGGGGGGGYSRSNAVTGLVAGNTAYVSVGAAGTGTTDGGQTWFNATSNTAPTTTAQGALANGGVRGTLATAGLGGSTTGAIGTTTFAGGNGGV